MNDQLVSICIPAYKQPEFVLRCLRSISVQTYKNIEVILSDDSPDEETKKIADQFSFLNLKYIHNNPPLKSPRNWNYALDLASGTLVMLLHQDDFLQREDSIERFVECFSKPEIDFAFCQNIGVDSSGKTIYFQNQDRIPDLMGHPDYLIIRCIIGPPSNVMLRNKINIRYDESLIWLVDVDYYIRILKSGYKYQYIKEHLVTIGIHANQTTEYVRAGGPVIFRENILVAKKIGQAAFKDIELYDHYWRLIRNHKVNSLKQIDVFGITKDDILPVIQNMIAFQKRISLKWLKKGIVSKSLMFISYLQWRFAMKLFTQQTF